MFFAILAGGLYKSISQLAHLQLYTVPFLWRLAEQDKEQKRPFPLLISACIVVKGVLHCSHKRSINGFDNNVILEPNKIEIIFNLIYLFESVFLLVSLHSLIFENYFVFDKFPIADIVIIQERKYSNDDEHQSRVHHERRLSFQACVLEKGLYEFVYAHLYDEASYY